jgi:hypothetical protein
LAQSEDRFERAQVLRAALTPLIDICVRIGVDTTALESLVRVEFVRRLAETLPGNLRTGRGPTHEEIGLAAGLNRSEVQAILAKGLKSAQMRMEKTTKRYSKSERIVRLWSESPRYLSSSSGLPLDLPLDLQAEGPSFTELVEKALPGKVPKYVLKDLRRRGLVQLLPDEIVRYRRGGALPAELNATDLAYAANHMRLLGNTLLQTMTAATDNRKKEIAVYAASEPVEIPADLIGVSHPAMLQRIESFIQGFELEFGQSTQVKKRKGPRERIGVSVYTWSTK